MKNSFLAIFLVFLFVGWFVILCGGQEDQDVAPMETKEKERLYLAIQGFIGKQWNGSDLYPDPCGWTPIQGVSCDLFDGFWYVTGLNIGPIYDNSLQCTNAKFSHQFFELTHLRSLTFFNCFSSPSQNPTEIPPSNWEKFSASLESLEFRSNSALIGTIPTSFGGLKRLQSLVLLENGLTGKIPMELGNLVSLRRLVLSGNRFNGEIPVSFGGLTEVLIIDLSRNNLSGSMPLTLGGLAALLKLDLSNNKLEGKLPKEIGNLKNVTLFDLRSNKFLGGLVQSLEEMISLKEMAMSSNPIGGELSEIQWENLRNLEILDLSNTNLTGEIPESMAKLKRLRFLGLNDNKLSGNIPPKTVTMPSLNALYLNGNNFTGKLEVSVWFYKKMGRRFGAWNNPNLCYKAEFTSTVHVPYGVKPC
ncbi:hypothetical protein Pint_16389 [Pistacia integerrima]|uniref:Uncharacterized protein n=1 Tax=Pistacia integerrima TaxID=434235 RepID=A0ACC0Z9Z5_9ROSI|nr:hypothetical protein Pint_16389 [Pistacia integerrima]